MIAQPCSRRIFIKQGISFSGLFLIAQLYSGCGTKESPPKKEQSKNSIDPCDDLSGLSESDIKTRVGLGYVKQSPQQNMQCNNCNLFLPPTKDKKCGGCLLFKGPVDAEGYCTNWAVKL